MLRSGSAPASLGFEIELRKCAGAYICGEETADAIESALQQLDVFETGVQR